MAVRAQPLVALLDGADDMGGLPMTVRECRYSGLAEYVADPAALAPLIEAGDAPVYRVATPADPLFGDPLRFSVTTIEPGAVGGELHMTRGHVHVLPRAEMYIGVAGWGGVLLSDFHDVRWFEARPGTIVTIPPGWAHRTVNLGRDPFRFVAVYQSDAGADYAAVAARGMGATVVRRGDGHRVVTRDGRELT